ncbi:uncharacterized protein RCC_01517 [Ramularia collo-cygni]|uniref:Uncharacterized protein n=1 Tax=Ramularia collo-cygni TaxID=112498 RepID=A0A2D3UZQ3_9PEZI|nr:uncharacterized protein RCC_01517 [Ramularia collo-cygni]CZT15684.1 uncharacterized protein RCC_01517 [Ramularia collo-cygni]
MDNKNTADQKPPPAQQSQKNQSAAQKRGFKIPAQVDTFEECSAERKKLSGDAAGKAEFNEFYWTLVRDMAIMENNMDVQLEYLRAIRDGEDCLERRVLLFQPHNASPEQEAAIRKEFQEVAVRGEREKAKRGEGVDDHAGGKWWEKSGRCVGMYKLDEEEK